MKLNKRKGFTIVELVIVIAVIAILAAVLIPNISNLVKKANASADESLVRNLNTALSMDVEKHQTMDAALEAAKTNGGYELTTIVTKNKDNKILWDSKNDCFVYMKKGASKPTYLPNTQEVKDVAPYDYFEILNELPADGKIPDSQTYSVYLAGNAYTGTVETPVGFDAGKNAVSKVTFKTAEKRSVLINTNGGEFEVEAEQASVEHRGEATIVTIKAVYDESYHENGKVNEIKLEKGRVVVEAKAEVGSILVTAAAATGVKVEVKDSATLGAIGAEKFNIKETTDIITGADKTEVVAGATGVSGFAGGFGTESAPYLIATVNQWLNFAKSEKAFENKYWSVISDLDFSDVTTSAYIEQFNGSIDFNGHTLKGLSAKYLYEESFLFAFFADAKLTNLNVFDVALIKEANYDKAGNHYPDGKVLLKNVNTYGSLFVTDNNTTPFIWDVDSGKVELNNCDNYMVIYNTGDACAAIYVGTLWSEADEVKFIDCDNHGNLIHSSGYSSMLISNGGNGVFAPQHKGYNTKGKAAKDIIVVSNCNNYGVIKGVTSVGLVNGRRNVNYTVVDCEGAVNHAELSTFKPTVISEYNGNLTLSNVNGASKYLISYTFWETAYDSNGEKYAWGSNDSGYSFTTDDLNKISLKTYRFINYSENLEKAENAVGDGKIYSATIGGNTYYVYNPNAVSINNYLYTIEKQPFLTVFAFDSEGRVMDVAVYQYSDTTVPSFN